MPDNRLLVHRLKRVFWRRNQPARLIMIDECGHRMEYVHDADDPAWWERAGEGRYAGWRGLENVVGNFLSSRSKEIR